MAAIDCFFRDARSFQSAVRQSISPACVYVGNQSREKGKWALAEDAGCISSALCFLAAEKCKKRDSPRERNPILYRECISLLSGRKRIALVSDKKQIAINFSFALTFSTFHFYGAECVMSVCTIAINNLGQLLHFHGQRKSKQHRLSLHASNSAYLQDRCFFLA